MPEYYYNHLDLLIAICKGGVPSEHFGKYQSDTRKSEPRQLFKKNIGICWITLMLQRAENAVFQQLVVSDLLALRGDPRVQGKNEHKCRYPEHEGKNCPYYLLNTYKFCEAFKDR